MIGHAVERKLFEQGRAVAMIDGESVRGGLGRDWGTARKIVARIYAAVVTLLIPLMMLA